MAKDPAIVAHQEWIGYVQPTGLVVSIPALIEASAFLNRNYGPDHQRFLSALPQDSEGEPIPEIPDFVGFARDVLGWDTDLMLGAPGADPVPTELEAVLENYNETLRPTYALRNLSGDSKWLLLVEVVPTGTDLDQAYAPHDRGWQASPQARFERLLRQTGISAGLLVNGQQIRLVYAPEKELSGHITFKLSEMVRVAGRPISAALQMLLCSERLYSVADKERLPAILANSRKYQNVVSTQLASQVLEALYELLRGFQAANDQTKGELLRDVLARDPDHVYRGLLTTLLRLVFVLYAEDRGLLSTDPIYSNHYSVTGLYERLRADAGRFNDTMDQRYGAWAQLLALFRLIYSGGSHAAMKIPAREGYLFDHDRYLFLEGRHDKNDKPVIPRVPDGVVYRVLSKLFLLDGERLSYRTLAVEQIGSVYEAIMGFELQVASGSSIAIRPAKTHGAPATVNLEELLRTAADKRLKLFTETTDQKLAGQAADGLKAATTIEELLVALDRKIAKAVTPNVVAQGAMIFQPSNERRKSGSHYTPSTLTGSIVEAALAPVLKQLGDNPTPQQILNLKACDPAMGSGAFLVEACRQLGDALVKAWHAHNSVPVLPPDEDEALYAQRQISQRCLYGVDKNPMAADLAKLSLWLATLAKDHPFTFLDHSLRSGDSLVGLTRQQIVSFHWGDAQGVLLDLERELKQRIDRISEYRRNILVARDDVPYAQLQQQLDGAEESLSLPRMIGDAVIAAYFSGSKPRDRENKRILLREAAENEVRSQHYIAPASVVDEAVAKLHKGPKGVAPFHWELEFPEVFTFDKDGKPTGGFDVIVGNPPFAGKNTLAAGTADAYPDWLKTVHAEAHGNADLVAHFFRRSFNLLRPDGCFGLIATNTIGQGDTRSTGLRWICNNDGTIYRAIKRLKWPGEAAVVVSVVHIARGEFQNERMLNGRPVEKITAYLFHLGTNDNPAPLKTNSGLTCRGCEIGSLGFLIDASDPEFDQLMTMTHPRLASHILKPYVGGRELNGGAVRRYVLDVDDLNRDDMDCLPMIRGILEETVRPDLLARHEIEPDTIEWWHFRRPSQGLREAHRLSRAIAKAQTSSTYAFVFVPPTSILSHKAIGFISERIEFFTVLQSRVHQVWAYFQGSTMKDDPVYAPDDCFLTFPFPESYESDPRLRAAGEHFYRTRSEFLETCRLGLTEFFNSFNTPHEESSGMCEVRHLQDVMDRAVLDAYGWQDIQPVCEFFPEFDDEEEEDENGRSKRKKFRYRWPEAIHDEVLARLLDLNRQRALEEGQLDSEAVSAILDTLERKRAAKKSAGKKPKDTSTRPMFGTAEGEA
jgi:N-6 DNA Methylase